MMLAIIAVCAGLALLVWSADRFVDGAASAAKALGMSPLLIGMLVVGFGTSAPEMLVSVMSALQGAPGIALGNAYGSNIANIALILGVTALIRPVMVHSQVLKKELPLLLGVTVLVGALLYNGNISRTDAVVHLAVFAGILWWSVRQGRKTEPAAQNDALALDVVHSLAHSDTPDVSSKGGGPDSGDHSDGADSHIQSKNHQQTEASTATVSPETGNTVLPVDEQTSLKRSLGNVAVGLAMLIGSSRLLVWGAVYIATTLGVSDLVIGLTVVAVGTSLPELAASVIACRKGESDLALGNVIGSNMFNTLGVVGLAGAIHPMAVPAEVLIRDYWVMLALTVSLFVLGYGVGQRQGRINRFEGALLVAVFVAYTVWVVQSVM